MSDLCETSAWIKLTDVRDVEFIAEPPAVEVPHPHLPESIRRGVRDENAICWNMSRLETDVIDMWSFIWLWNGLPYELALIGYCQIRWLYCECLIERMSVEELWVWVSRLDGIPSVTLAARSNTPMTGFVTALLVTGECTAANN